MGPMARISDYTHIKQWDVITNQYPPIEVRTRMSNHIIKQRVSSFIMSQLISVGKYGPIADALHELSERV